MTSSKQILQSIAGFIISILNSYSIIIFSSSGWIGLILLAVTMLSPYIGLSGLIGIIVALLVSRIAGYEQWDSKSGLFALNSFLVCLSFAYIVPLEWIIANPILYIIILIFIAIITFFAFLIVNWLIYRLFQLSSMSLTFSLIAIVLWLILGYYGAFHAYHADKPLLYQWSPKLPEFFIGYFHSMGSILFLPYILVGLIVAIIVLLMTRIGFVLTLFGWTVCYYLMNMMGYETHDGISYQGFNLVLVFYAIGGVFLVPGIKTWLFAFISALIAFFISVILPLLNPFYAPPVFALPFNLTVIFMLYALKLRIKSTPPFFNELIVSTPEQGLEFFLTRIKRFSVPGIPQFILPFVGEWIVSQGHHGKYTHKDIWSFAWDFELQDKEGKRWEKTETNLHDHYAFGKPVLASASGYVAKVYMGIPDNLIDQINTKDNWGNYLVLSHGYGIYSLYAHLKHDSIFVKQGDYVSQGTKIALVGNSGRSPRPHLHFQIQLGIEPSSSTRLAHFVNYKKYINDNVFEFISSGIPAEGEFVSSLSPNYKLQEILHFSNEQTQKFQVKTPSHTFTEDWNIVLDLYGKHYILSSKKNKLEFSVWGGIYTTLELRNHKKSALYAFAILLSRFPYAEKINLCWTDTPSISVVFGRIIRNLILLITPLINPFYYKTKSTSIDKDSLIYINSETIVKFLGIKLIQWNGSVVLDKNQGIQSFCLYKNNSLYLETQRINED